MPQGLLRKESSAAEFYNHNPPQRPLVSGTGDGVFAGRGNDMDMKKTRLELDRFLRGLERKPSECGPAAEALLQGNEHLKKIVSAVKTGIVVIDAERHTIEGANEAALNMIGAPQEMVLGAECHKFICPAAKGHCPITDHGQIVDNSIRVLQRADGEKLPIIKTVVEVTLDNRRHLVESFIDLSEIKRTEDALAASEIRFRELFNHMSSGVAVYEARNEGRDFILVDFNSAAEQIEKIQKKDIIGKNVLEVFPGIRDFGLYDVLQQVWKTGIPARHPVTMYEDDRISGWRGNYVCRLPSGEIVAIYDDITEQKKAAEELQRTAEKVKLFSYSMAHDLKNPLIGLQGLTRLLHKSFKDALGEKGGQYCEQILKKSEQISALVDKVNAFIAVKELPLKREATKLHTLLDTLKDDYAAQLQKSRVNWKVAARPLEIHVDREAVMRALRNLIDNAFKYGGENLSEIQIGCVESKEFHILSVQDDGIGLDAQETAGIFDLFKRQSTSKGTEGTGLGLAIVKEIAERHGGSAWVESNKNRGATFYISIAKGK